MTFDEWWKFAGKLDEGGKDDWRECWEAAVLMCADSSQKANIAGVVGFECLVSVGDNDAPQQTNILRLSPNGKYAQLGSDRVATTLHGWFPVWQITVVDVLGKAR